MRAGGRACAAAAARGVFFFNELKPFSAPGMTPSKCLEIDSKEGAPQVQNELER
jgi:hypothetical protein